MPTVQDNNNKNFLLNKLVVLEGCSGWLLKNLKPGDVFVYPVRKGAAYGHAVLVVDVAVNASTGELAFLLAEGNTPARDLHVLRNLKHPFSAPWFIVDGSEKSLRLGPFLYYPNEIRRF